MKKKKTTPVLMNDGLNAEACSEHWITCPASDIPNMFATHYQDLTNLYVQQRAISFYLPDESMEMIAAQYAKKNKNDICKLRVYMGCNPNYTGKILSDSPAFCPFVQLIIAKKNAPQVKETYENMFSCEFARVSPVPINDQILYVPPSERTAFNQRIPDAANPSLISPKSAHLFIEEWSLIQQEEMKNVFSGNVYGQQARVNSFTYLDADVESIITLYNQSKNKGKTIFVHMGVIERNARSPFEFHIILQVAEPIRDLEEPKSKPKKMTKAAKNKRIELEEKEEDGFFEYGYPCPPYCGRP